MVAAVAVIKFQLKYIHESNSRCISEILLNCSIQYVVDECHDNLMDEIYRLMLLSDKLNSVWEDALIKAVVPKLFSSYRHLASQTTSP